MMVKCSRHGWFVVASIFFAVGCDQPADGVDGSIDAADEGGENGEGVVADGGEDERDEDRPAVSGAMTLIMSEVALVGDRVCDLDGDGTLDNSIANLGSPASELMLAAINAASFQTEFETSSRTIILFPWIDDLSGPHAPSTVLIGFGGEDTDVPVDRTDDFSGEEPFYARHEDLDGCGEPVIASENASIDQGVFSLDEDATPFIPVDVPFTMDNLRLTGTIAPFGESAVLFGCFFAPIGVLGRSETTVDGTEMTALELLLAGGATLGLPIPGGSLDVDVDGDGLERVIVDEDGHVESCVDGDRTTIPGADCWSDERMVDGVSFTARVAMVSASFSGRQPGWEDLVEGPCDDPPETSIFGEL